jgi:TrmH family RNA methyltransferase
MTGPTITSPHNARLKDIRRLARRRERERTGCFVAEGEDLLAAASRAGWVARETYVTAGSGPAGTEVEPAVLAAASTLRSGTRALAVYEQRWAPAPVGPLCVALDGVGDPGNVGAVLRAALAFGAASVALGPGCTDPFSPKAVRASMGAIFAVSVARFEQAMALPGERIALVAGRGEPLGEALAARRTGSDAPAPCPPDGGGTFIERTLVVGAERAGLRPELERACDRVAHIPIRSDSLNAAMAATVALYEVTRRMAAP